MPGSVHAATVISVVSFGAFVRLETGASGLVHISEVSDTYVTNITDVVGVNESVQVKFLRTNDKGKLEFSMRQAQPTGMRILRRSDVENEGFEEKVNQFLKRSDSVLIDVRRNLKVKQGLARKKRTSRKKG
ncbi:MAG: RNA-binding protein S1 [Planctomycetes bacterium]|nr:RNA-binding protein S1 [Planctomycetota bacterium]